MDERASARAKLLPAVARRLRSVDFLNEVADATGDRNNTSIVVVLPDDRMSYVFDRLREGDGTGVIALPRSGRIETVVCAPASDARIAVAAEDGDVTSLHSDSTVSMFFDYIKLKSGVVVIEHRTAARLLDDDAPVCC